MSQIRVSSMGHGRELFYSRKLNRLPVYLLGRQSLPLEPEDRIDALWCEHFCRLTRPFRSDRLINAASIPFDLKLSVKTGHVIARFERAIKTELGQTRLRPIFIVSTSDTRDIVDKHKLSIPEYMDAVSRSDFLICPPGWLTHHSYNLIEAMSVD